MNVFVIPSWYPSPEDPLYGIFIKEQMLNLAENHNHLNLGISYWGQGNEKHLLWARDHLKNLVKIYKYNQLQTGSNPIRNNCVEYYTPALTWTRRILAGNKKNIIEANHSNLNSFQKEFGKADIIHAQAIYPAGYIALSLARQYDIPYVITARMSPFPFAEFLDKAGRLKPLIDRPLKNADRIIAISNSLKEKLRNLGYVNTTTIHNLARDRFFTPEKRKPTPGFTFLTIGRIVHQKGLDVLLQSISTIRHLDIRLEIVGKGIEMEKLKNLASELKIDDKVRWTGELDRNGIKEAIRQCDCLVLASRHETFGNVLTEGIACGKPIIATACGGPEDIVNQTNGLLARVNDPEDLASKMAQMINCYEKYDPTAIRADFEKRFSSKVITPKIVALYNEVIKDYAMNQA